MATQQQQQQFTPEQIARLTAVGQAASAGTSGFVHVAHLDNAPRADPSVWASDSEAAVVADVVERESGAFLIGDAGEIAKARFAVLPRGKRLESLKPILDQYLPRPERAVGFATLRTVESFIAHVLRHADLRRSVIFADHESSAFRAVYDYDSAGTTGGEPGMYLAHPLTDGEESLPRIGDFTAPGEPGWRGHGATYIPQFSSEFRAWGAIAGKPLTGDVFAQFLEEHVQDLIGAPLLGSQLETLVALLGASFGTPSDLIAVSRNLQVNVNTVVNDARTLATGEVSIGYAEQHTNGTGQPITVPTLFGIGIPVYYGEEAFQIGVQLRYRINASKITWTVMPYRLDIAQMVAFEALVTRVGEGTGIPTFEGVPQ